MESWYRKTLQACTDTLLDEYCIPPKVKDIMDKMFTKEYLTERQWFYIMETVQTEDKMRQLIAYLLDPNYKNIKAAFEYLVQIIVDEGRSDISNILTDTLEKMKHAVGTCDVKDSWYQKTLQQCRRTLLEDYSIPTQVDCLMDRMMEEEYLTISQRQYINEWGHTRDKVKQLIDFLLADNHKDIKGAYELLIQVLIDDGRSDIAQVLKDTLKKTKKMTPEQEENIKSVEDIHELVIRLQQQIQDQEITGKDLLHELKRLDDTFGTFKVSHIDSMLQSVEESLLSRGTSLVSKPENDVCTPENRSTKSSSSESGDVKRTLTEFDNSTHESDSEHLSTSVGGDLTENTATVMKLYEEGANDEDIILTLTQFPDSINMTNDNYQTLLMLACRDINIKLVRILLNTDAINVNKKDIMGRTALFYSILEGDVELIREMFKCDKINTREMDNNGFRYIWYIFQIDLVMYLTKAQELNMLSFTEYVLDGFIAGMGEVKATLDWTRINTIVDCLLSIDNLDHTDLLKAFLLMGKEDIVLRILQKGNVTINQRTIMIFVTNAIISGNKNCLITLVDFPSINLNILPEEELCVIVQSVLRHNRRCVSAYMLRVINDLNIDQHKLMAYKLAMSFQTLKSDALSFFLDSYNLSNLSLQDDKGNSVYSLLCKYGSLALMSIILQRSDIDFTECRGDDSFMMSLQNRSTEIPKLLLQHPNVNVNHSDPSGVTNLHQACNTGNIEIIEAIANSEINVNAKDANGLTAMMGTCITGRTDAVCTLLKSNKVNLDLTDHKGRNALMFACGKGDLEMVGSLLTEMKDPNAADNEGRTSLMFGCRSGNWEVVELLLTHKTIQVNAQDSDGKSALIHSIEAGDCKSTQVLLKFDKIDPNQGDNEGKTPLIYVCDNSDGNAEKLVSMLVAKKNIDVNRQDCHKKTGLAYAVERGNNNIAKILLQPELKVNAATRDLYGMTSFLYGCETRNEEIVFSLLETNQINVNEPTAQGITPFEYAYKSDNTNILARLLQTNEIDVNKIDSGGEVALTHAVKNGKVSVAEMLLKEHSIDVNATDTHRKTALIYVCHSTPIIHRYYRRILDTLIGRDDLDVNHIDAEGKTGLIHACQGGHDDTVNTLMNRRDLDINHSDVEGKTALIYACQVGSYTTVQRLMKRDDLDINHSDAEDKSGLIHACQGQGGPFQYLVVPTLMERDDLDINHSDAEGKTGLIRACQRGDWPTVVTLMKRDDLDINHIDAEGKSGLIHACQGGYYNTVYRLTTRLDLDINHSDAERKTGFIYACQGGYWEIVDRLMDLNVLDINHSDVDGKTGLIYACEHGHYSTIERLTQVDDNHDIDINHSDSEGKTALIHACENGDAGIVGFLVIRRKDINKDCVDINGKTAYMYAQEHNDDELLQAFNSI